MPLNRNKSVIPCDKLHSCPKQLDSDAKLFISWVQYLVHVVSVHLLDTKRQTMVPRTALPRVITNNCTRPNVTHPLSPCPDKLTPNLKQYAHCLKTFHPWRKEALSYGNLLGRLVSSFCSICSQKHSKYIHEYDASFYPYSFTQLLHL